MKNYFLFLMLLPPLLCACHEKGTFSFYTQYTSYKEMVVKETQKQEFKEGKYHLEVVNITKHNEHGNSSHRTNLFMIDSNYIEGAHYLSEKSGYSGFTLTNSLYFTSAKTFKIEGKPVDVLRFRTSGSAYDCCVSYDVYFWNPEYGLIYSANINGAFEVITEMMAEQREYLYKPAQFSTREALKTFTCRDQAFYYQANSGHLVNYRFGNCVKPNTEVENCQVVLELQQIARESLEYPDFSELNIPGCYSGHITTSVFSDEEGNLCFPDLRLVYTFVRGLEGYEEYFRREAILALTRLPSSINPLRHEGISLNANIDLPFNFSIPDSSRCGEVFRKMEEEKGKKVYEVVDEAPIFRGGNEELEEYIQQNLVVPVKMDPGGMEKKLVIGFVLNQDGQPEDIRIIRSFEDNNEDEDAELPEQEAIRLIREMPAWTPGKMRGKKVRVKKVVVLNFSTGTGYLYR